MTKKQAMKKFKELLSDVNKSMVKKAETILDDIDLTKYDNDYLLPKTLISALLERESNRRFPLDADAYFEAKRLANY